MEKVISEKDRKELEELHELIKNNKFREDIHLNLKYGLGYFDLMYKFIDKFYALTRENKNNENNQLSKVDPLLFVHDFRSCITSSRSYVYWLLKDEENDEESKKYQKIREKYNREREEDWKQLEENIIELEYFIISLHQLIKVGRFDTFYAWEKGVFLQYEWNEDTKLYEPVHIIKEYKPGNKEHIIKNNLIPTLRD